MNRKQEKEIVAESGKRFPDSAFHSQDTPLLDLLCGSMISSLSAVLRWRFSAHTSYFWAVLRSYVLLYLSGAVALLDLPTVKVLMSSPIYLLGSCAHALSTYCFTATLRTTQYLSPTSVFTNNDTLISSAIALARLEAYAVWTYRVYA